MISFLSVVNMFAFQLWKSVLISETSQDKEIADGWNQCIHNIIKRRVAAVRKYDNSIFP